VQQLQCRLRVSCGLDVGDSGGCDMSIWSLQRVWRDGVQQLQRRLRLSHSWLYQCDCLAVSCWIVQWQRLIVMWRV
jgi:hypothetical protein